MTGFARRYPVTWMTGFTGRYPVTWMTGFFGGRQPGRNRIGLDAVDIRSASATASAAAAAGNMQHPLELQPLYGALGRPRADSGFAGHGGNAQASRPGEGARVRADDGQDARL